jgi:hypothetical protein
VRKMRRTILLLAGAALLLVSMDAGAEGIRPSSDAASASKQHERTITAELTMGVGYTKGALFVQGKLNAGPGHPPCEKEQLVRLQRLWPSGWRAMRRNLTGSGWGGKANGYMMIVKKGKHPTGSKWRVVAPESTLADGDVCLRVASPVMVHRRQS